MNYIYILELNENKICIAQCNKYIENICEFFNSINDDWINRYKISNILELIQTNKYDELTSISEQYIEKIGIENFKIIYNI